MPNQTTNYNLTKPLETERYDVQVFNNNADIIDTQMKSNADGIANVNSRLDNLNSWTTVEFTLADFTYDENTRVTYLPIEAPSGYKFKEVRGFVVLNKNKVDSTNTYILIQQSIAMYDSIADTNRACNVITVGTNAIGCINRVNVDYNYDLKYVTTIGSYGLSAELRSEQSTSNTIAMRGKSLLTDSSSENRITIDTNVPYTNISEFYGKLQYRVVPS